MPQELVNQTEIILDRNNLEEVGEQRQVVQVQSLNCPRRLRWCPVAHF